MSPAHRGDREGPPETVPCVVCGTGLPLPDGMVLDRPPFCSKACHEKWQSGADARAGL